MEEDYKIHNLKIKGINNEDFNDEFYSKKCEKIDFHGVIQEKKIITQKSSDYITLAPKYIPHSDYELMLQSTDSLCKSSITSLSDESLKYIFGVGYEFIDFFSNAENISKFEMQGGYPYLVYNYDEFTTDRHSGMSKKPFHLHLNSWTNKTINSISKIEKDEVSSFYYKSVVDPIFNIVQVLTKDALDCEELKEYFQFEKIKCNNQNISYSATYKILDGWNFLQNDNMPRILKTIHLRLEKRYVEILNCISGYDIVPKLYTRHPLLPEETIKKNIYMSNMQDTTKEVLYSLTEKLKTITPEQFNKMSTKNNIRDSLISLRWLAYSVGLFSNSYLDTDSSHINKSLYVNITPRLFTKIGGASIMNFPDYAHVKIDRGVGNVSDEEFSKKLEFHKKFTKKIN